VTRWWREQKTACTVLWREGLVYRQNGISGSSPWTVSVRPDGTHDRIAADVSRKLYRKVKAGDRLVLLRGGACAHTRRQESPGGGRWHHEAG
jgi:hypothetical protein